MDDQEQITTPEAPNLALSDLALLLNLVRATAERGAIKAEEMTAVGAVYEKLFKFLQASGALTPPTPEDSVTQESSQEA
jgi:hypothetical protein